MPLLVSFVVHAVVVYGLRKNDRYIYVYYMKPVCMLFKESRMGPIAKCHEWSFRTGGGETLAKSHESGLMQNVTV